MERKKKREDYLKLGLAVFFAIGIFIFVAPSNLGAFLSPLNSNNSGRISSAQPLGEAQFRAPVLAGTTEQAKFSGAIEINGKLYWPSKRIGQGALFVLVPLTDEEIAAYHRYKDASNTKDKKTPVALLQPPQQPTLTAAENEDEEEKEVPPGIEKQGDNKHEDKGRHLGWGKGKHLGWEKQEAKEGKGDNEDEEDKVKLEELNLELVGKDNKAKSEVKLAEEKPSLELKDVPEPIEEKEDTLGLKQVKVKEIRLENSGLGIKSGLSNPNLKFKTLAGEAR